MTIGNNVTSIGENAFEFCSSLTSVYITDIAAWCNISFSNSSSNPLYYAHNLYLNNEPVTDLTIPNGVTSIVDGAFASCNSLITVTIPGSVTSLGPSVFSGCSNLTSVTIGNGVTSIGEYTFSYCSSLTSVTIPDSITTIDYYAFDGCDNLAYNEENGLKYLGNPDNPYLYLMKASQDIETVQINNRCKVIGDSAFSGCSKLTSVTIGSSVTSIGRSAFRYCSSLANITIPDSVTSIGFEAFIGCSKLTSVTIGNGVTTIGGSAFRYCSGLTSVTIGNNVTSIGEYAFDGCDNLAYNEENGLKYLGNPDNPYLYLMKVSQDIETAQINNRCKAIVDRAFFNCSGLTSVTIGSSVTSIGENAFDNCTDLKNIVLFPSVPPTLYTNSIPATISNIYVQQSSEERYKTATNWIAFAEKIQSNNIYLSLVRFNKKNKEYIDKKLTKPTNPSAESAVTMLADGTVGTKLLSDFINKPATPTADSAVTLLADGTVGTKLLS